MVSDRGSGAIAALAQVEVKAIHTVRTERTKQTIDNARLASIAEEVDGRDGIRVLLQAMGYRQQIVQCVQEGVQGILLIIVFC